MVFRTFDRLLFVAMETTEGSLNSSFGVTGLNLTDPSSDYIESVEPTFSITNRVYDRNPTRLSITPAPKTVTGRGTAFGEPSAACEFSFGIELSGAGLDGAGTGCVEPGWAKLLTCCGMEQRTLTSVTITNPLAVKAGSPAVAAPPPWRLRNRENIGVGGSDAYAAGGFLGRNFGGTTMADTKMYYDITDASGTVLAGGEKVYGEATDAWANTTATYAPFALIPAATAKDTVTNIGWIPTSDSTLGGSTTAAGGSCSIALWLSTSNQYIVASGCRGNVEFVCTSGDRVLMNFTMTGKLEGYIDSGVPSVLPSVTGVEQPPGFTNTALSIFAASYGAANDLTPYTGTIFNAMNINLGNEVTIRENVSNSTGYDVSYITGRASSMTFNPDAKIQSTSYDFWDSFLSGDQTDMKITIGSDVGNKFLFRMPAMQFSGVADGNRDEVMVFDSTTTLTGGDMGESVQQNFGDDETDGNTILDPRLGTNNEFHLILLGN